MDRRIEENLAKHEAYFEGALENQKQVVLNIYDNNLSLEVISKCTELSIEEVETIIKNNR